MARGRKTGGRRKGSVNKTTKAAVIAASGLAPLDYLLAIMRDENIPRHERVDAAKAACGYCHPRLTATELTGKDGGPLQIGEALMPVPTAQGVMEALTKAARELGLPEVGSKKAAAGAVATAIAKGAVMPPEVYEAYWRAREG